MKNISFTLYLFILSLFLASCFPVTTTNTAKRQTSGSVYNPFIYRLHPEYIVYNNNSSDSRLYAKIYLTELMFAPIGKNRASMGKIKIEYKIFRPEDLNNYIDSSTIVYDIKKHKGENNVIIYVNIADKGLGEYYMLVKTSDLLRQTEVEEYIYVNKTEPSCSQNFMVNLKGTAYPYFKNYFRKDQVFAIKHNTPTDSIFLRFYKEKVPLPPPPFSSSQPEKFNVPPDSIWSVAGNSDFQFNESRKGLYYIQTDTNSTQGLSFLNPGDDFPNIKTSECMLYPLEYLMNSNEFKQILESDNKKLAVDKFWISCGGDLNRARELIRIYYNRTLYANIYFTSITDGWRTDRGMIYLMFGPPKAVKKSPNKEIWLYSDRMNYKVLQFVFNRLSNPYTNNDFVLERSIDFKRFWFESIESWRKGKVYTVFN